MTIKKIIVSAFAVAALGTAAMAQQGGQPNQPPRGAGRGGDGMMNREDNGRGFGDRMRGGRMGMPGGSFGRMDFARLNLTDAQKVRIQALMDNQDRTRQANQAQSEEMFRLMRLKREGLLTTEQGARLTSLEAQMTTNADRLRSDLLAILTPEQRTIFEQSKNMRGGRGGMMQRPGMPGAPNRMNGDRPTGNMPPPSPPNNN